MVPINRLLSGGLPVRPTGGSSRRISQETLDAAINGTLIHPSKYKSEENVGNFLTSYAKNGSSDDLLEQATRIEKEKRALIMLEHNTAGRHNEGQVLHEELQRYSNSDTLKAQRMYDEQVLEDKGALNEARSLYAARNEPERLQKAEALERVRNLEGAAVQDGSISGLLNRKNQIINDAVGSVEGMGKQDKIALNRLKTGTDYERPLTELENAEITELNAAINRIGLEDENFFQKTLGGYNEAAHTSANTTTAAESMSGGTTGNFVGRYQPGETPSSSGLLGSMSQDGAAGVMSSMAFGAGIGGVANYAMGGEFGEGAMMGGLAGGAIKIGARAIQQNRSSIEGFLQRTALGDAGQGLDRAAAAARIQDMPTAGENAGLMQRGAFNILKSENPSLGMQSRYMVMGGSALSGVMFTGSRKDKRRGFNAHRGNRI